MKLFQVQEAAYQSNDPIVDHIIGLYRKEGYPQEGDQYYRDSEGLEGIAPVEVIVSYIKRLIDEGELEHENVLSGSVDEWLMDVITAS